MLKLIKLILDFSGKYKPRILAAFVFAFIKSMLIKMPICLGVYAIMRFLEGSFTFNDFIFMAVAMLLSVVFQCILQNIADRLQSAAGYILFAEKRNSLAAHLRKMPMGYFTEGNLGRISSILSNDMVFIEENCMQDLANLMSEIFSQVIMIAFLFVMNVWLGLVGLAALILLVFAGNLSVASGLKDAKVRQEEAQKLTESALDFSEGIGIIKTYNLFGDKSKDFKDRIESSCKTSIAFEENQSCLQLLLNVFFAIGTTGILVAGLYLFSIHQISLIYLLGMMIFVFDFLIPAKVLYGQNSRLTVMKNCMDRIKSLFNETELQDSGTEHLDASAGNGTDEISFENVSFGYGTKEVLHNVSFGLQKNKMLALVGSSGSGKTTIANLIARFWDCNEGSVKIRGKDIRSIPLSELMNNISMVFQRVYLFQDTIYNNICIGRPDATKEEVYDAARKAGCYDFIMALPDGFNTVIGEGGATLSGGEKQRISISRCILKDAPIVILDEATASVDAENERLIQNAISELCKGKTLIVIAHRLNTIRNADKILVIDGGKIAEAGTHSQLMKNDGMYKKFMTIRQNSKGWNRA
ncbi:MAG: ABC transporter ATP-binding protein/permease [Treponema sp.]|nr:ABC transporter ATP-binding protein/permease [Treponema sp.]